MKQTLNVLSRPNRKTQLKLGICGHPVYSYAGTSNTIQMTRIADLKLQGYRVNVDRSDTQTNTNFAAVLTAAAVRGIEVLPVIVPTDVAISTNTEAQNYTAGFNLAAALVTTFPNVKVWECGNEQEGYAMVNEGETRDNGQLWEVGWGDPAGYDVNDYLAARYNQVRGLIKGLIAGVKSKNSGARIGVGTSGWFHYGFLQRLINDGVQWDFTCWHWYSEMGDPTNADAYYNGEKRNVLAELKKFGKPIWFTEFDKRDGDLESQWEQARWLEYFIDKLKAWAPIYNIEWAHIYQLLDQPEIGDWDGEAHYGLLTIDGGGAIVAEKTAYQTVKSHAVLPVDPRIPFMSVGAPTNGSTFVDTVTSGYTILFDVNLTALPTAVAFMLCNNTNYTGFQVGKNNQARAAYYNNVAAKGEYTDIALTTGANKIAFVFSGGTMTKIFLGTGGPETLTHENGGVATLPTGSTTWRVGQASGAGYDLNGSVTNIRIWHTALPDDVIRGVMESEL